MSGPRASADPLDANERQEGQWRSSTQVRGLMSDDRGHLRAMRLLPFAAAGTKSACRPGLARGMLLTSENTPGIPSDLRLRSRHFSMLPGRSRVSGLPRFSLRAIYHSQEDTARRLHPSSIPRVSLPGRWDSIKIQY